MKKGWKKPVITVIERGTIEESVLLNCKTNGAASPGPVSADGPCTHHENSAQVCKQWQWS